MDSQRYLRCLGHPALFAATGEPIRLRTRKHLALLVYLAVENRSHRRDRLAELLWPRVRDSEARHSLATALSMLRPRLGPDDLEAGRDHVRLVPGRIGLDLDRFKKGDVTGTDLIEPLEVGPFLDGFEIGDSAEFTQWKDQQQAQLLPVVRDALLELINRCRRNGDTRRIEQLADRMLALDHLCEDAIRAKMEARAFAGDRLAALEIFESWKKKLAEELQATPSSLVEGMAVRLRRRGWERTKLVNVPNVPTDQWRGRPFIGRTTEYRTLYGLWEAVVSGVSEHALIIGDSGVGKTTLIHRLTTAAGLEGAAVSRVQCYDLEREIPYSTLSTLITGLLNQPGVSATSPEALAELGRTIPRIRSRFPGLPSSAEAQGETVRLRFTEALHELLTALAEEQPVVLVIDDLHLADDVSLSILHLLLRRVRNQRIMVVLAARPGELRQASQASRLRESGEALRIHEIPVLPLAERESREMLWSLVDPNQGPAGGEQRALLQAAAGNPMAIELLMQDWKEHGDQSLALSVGAMTPDFSAEGPAQASYQHLLDRICRSLETPTQNVLNLAALLGPRLNDLSLYALMDISAGQTMSSMTELVRRRVLRDGAQGLEFVNELLRGAAYLGVPLGVRRILHGAIADRYIEKHKSGAEELGLEIAWHCMRAGRVVEATPYLMAGARECLAYGAVHAAERALSSAIPHLGGTEHEAAVLLLAEVLQEQGRWAESHALLQSAGLVGAREPELATVIRLLAEHWCSSSDAGETIARIETLRGIVQNSADLNCRIRAAKVISHLMSLARDAELAKRCLHAIDSIAAAALRLDDLASLAASKAVLLYYAVERGACLTEIVGIAGRLQEKKYVNSSVASLRNGVGVILCCEGRYREGKAEFEKAYAMTSALGNDTLAAHRAIQLGLCFLRLGQYREAIDWCEKASGSFGAHFNGYTECQAACYAGCSHALLGEPAEALRHIENVDRRLPAAAPAWLTQSWLLEKADVLLLAGLRNEACASGRRALGESLELHSKFSAGPFARWLALTAVTPEEHERALARLTEMVEELDAFDCLDQVEVLCAMQLLGSGPLTEAHRALIERNLATLPGAVTEQLTRLGMFEITAGVA